MPDNEFIVFTSKVRPLPGRKGQWPRITGAVIRADEASITLRTKTQATGPWDKRNGKAYRYYETDQTIPRQRFQRSTDHIPTDYINPTADPDPKIYYFDDTTEIV